MRALNTRYVAVAPKALDKSLAFVRAGGRLLIESVTRPIYIDAKILGRWERAGEWLLREDGDGYRLRNGRGSVYVFSTQLLAEEIVDA